MRPDELTIDQDGAQLFKAALSESEVRQLENALSAQPQERAGVRLAGIQDLQPFLGPADPIGQIPAHILGPDCFAVRAILFDKSAGQNWSLGWHQDRTIAVSKQIDVEGFGPWSVKGGMIHVEPPIELLSRMITVRVHLDSVTNTNAPLLIATASHAFGRISTEEIPEVVHRCGVIQCTAEVGDIWAYSTPILHASDAAVEPTRRRVLQIDYAAEQLPDGLKWLGV